MNRNNGMEARSAMREHGGERSSVLRKPSAVIVALVLALLLTGCGNPLVDEDLPGDDDDDGSQPDGMEQFYVFDDAIVPELAAHEIYFWNDNGGQPFTIDPSTSVKNSGEASWYLNLSEVDTWGGFDLELSKTWNFAEYDFNAFSFWIRGTATGSGGDAGLNVIGFGNDTTPALSLANLAVSDTWKKVIIPIPHPERLKTVIKPFYFADNGGSEYYLDDVQFEDLGDAAYTLNSFSIPNQSKAIATGATWTIGEPSIGTSSFNYTIDGAAVVVTGKGATLVDWVSANEAVATVNDGVVTGVAAGNTTLSPHALDVDGTGTITITVN